jgi:phosphopantothenoylcysteine decarboxylase/phosphopantothenate--cysteine ligase
MRCIVTAGPTFESLDRVRRLTNFSTGHLGTLLADTLTEHGHSVVLLRGEMASAPLPRLTQQGLPFASTIDLASRFLEFATDESIAVFHAAAVADFTPTAVHRRDPAGHLHRLTSPKFSTRDGSLFVELRPTPKLLPSLRTWFPAARIFGWKYEAEGDHTTALARGHDQLLSSRSDVCVVNGPAHGPGFTALFPGGRRVPLAQPSDLCRWLCTQLSEGADR